MGQKKTTDGEFEFTNPVKVGEPTVAGHATTRTYADENLGGAPLDVSGRTKNTTPIWDGDEYQHIVIGAYFTFSIATFTDNEAGTVKEIGAAGTWMVIGALTFNATYINGPPNVTPTVQIGGQFTPWVSPLDMTTGPAFEGPTNSAEAIAYPAAPSSSAGTITLSATDGEDPDTAINYFYFYNNVHWGVDSADITDSAGINSLAGKGLQNTRVKTFTVDAAVGEYLYYAVPVRLGDPTPWIGGFEGGMTKTVASVSCTNTNGYIENYAIWKSDNSGLGDTTVEMRA